MRVCAVESEDQDVVDEAAMDYIINSGMQDLTYDGFEVVPVKVPNNSSKIVIHEETFDNDLFDGDAEKILQKVMESKSFGQRKLTDEHPDIAANLRLFAKHADVRNHAYYFVKCHKLESSKACKHCKENPPQCTDKFWATLPKRERGGLFYGVEEDLANLGHNRTFLDMMSEVDSLSIVPDGEYNEVKRCKVRYITHYEMNL